MVPIRLRDILRIILTLQIGLATALTSATAAQKPETNQALEKLKTSRYLPLAVSKAIEKGNYDGEAAKGLPGTMGEWAKAQVQGAQELAQIENVTLPAAKNQGNDSEVERLTALKAAKTEELTLATEILLLDISMALGDDKVDSFLLAAASEVDALASELPPDEMLQTLQTDAFSQMNAAVQLMNYNNTVGRQVAAMTPERVETLRRNLADLFTRYQEVVTLLKQHELGK